jgi:hypothetical protein
MQAARFESHLVSRKSLGCAHSPLLQRFWMRRSGRKSIARVTTLIVCEHRGQTIRGTPLRRLTRASPLTPASQLQQFTLQSAESLVRESDLRPYPPKKPSRPQHDTMKTPRKCYRQQGLAEQRLLLDILCRNEPRSTTNALRQHRSARYF